MVSYHADSAAGHPLEPECAGPRAWPCTKNIARRFYDCCRSGRTTENGEQLSGGESSSCQQRRCDGARPETERGSKFTLKMCQFI